MLLLLKVRVLYDNLLALLLLWVEMLLLLGMRLKVLIIG